MLKRKKVFLIFFWVAFFFPPSTWLPTTLDGGGDGEKGARAKQINRPSA